MVSTLLTLCIYLIVYIIAFFFFKMANNNMSLQKKKLILIVVILFLSVFSSMRSVEVGTDTITTISMYFDEANKYSSFSLMISNNIEITTMIFLLLSKCIQFLGLGYKTFLFILQLLVIFPIVLASYVRERKNSIALVMLMYMLLYYQLSFNWIRQSISASFLILSVIMFIEKKRKSAVVSAVISALFHASALLGVILYVIAWISSKSKSVKFRRLLVIGAVVLTVIVMKNWQSTALWMINKRLLPASYIGYVNVFSGTYGTSFKGWYVIGQKTYVEYMLRIVIFVVPGYIINSRNICKRDSAYTQELNFFRMCSLLSVLIYSAAIFGLHTAYANRITYFLDYANVFYLALTSEINTNRKKFNVTYHDITVFFIALSYNIWLYYIMGWHETVPFYFFFENYF